MRGTHLIPLYSVAVFLVVTSFYYLAGAWRKILDARVLTGTRIRQLNAIANNLSRIIMATETESALLNRDINRFLKLVQTQVKELKANETILK
ncbi:hypothetical protein NPIL_465861 [Nephila pilipes]|uniref:Uncharacterized protein n=1 Tax=Nephila pilipes TaxID=299642 RepID=A0A8X6PMY6_NEPPI|nr:hypothetical protein NPIL_465861 [Nephila pilipes]